MQEDIKPLTTENAVTKDGIKVRPREDVKIIGTGQSKFLPVGSEHTVHRIQADKLVTDGKANYANDEDKPKAAKADKKGKEDKE